MKNQPASVRHRFSAGCVNVVLGTFPLSVPNALYAYSTSGQWYRDELKLDGFALILGAIQLVLTHRMQGSLGFAFCGLAVEKSDGSSPAFKDTFLRGIPFILGFICLLAMPRTGGCPRLVGILGVILGGCLVFAAASAAFVMLKHHASLIDRFTRTQVRKRY